MWVSQRTQMAVELCKDLVGAITDADPTGIAKAVFGLAIIVRDRWKQMEQNVEECKYLGERVDSLMRAAEV